MTTTHNSHQTCQVYTGEDCTNPATVLFRWGNDTLLSCDQHYSWTIGDLWSTQIAPWVTFLAVEAAA